MKSAVYHLGTLLALLGCLAFFGALAEGLLAPGVALILLAGCAAAVWRLGAAAMACDEREG